MTVSGKRLLAAKRPAFNPRDVQDFPPSLVQLMQRCWHQVNSRILPAAARKKMALSVSHVCLLWPLLHMLPT